MSDNILKVLPIKRAGKELDLSKCLIPIFSHSVLSGEFTAEVDISY